MHCRTSLENTCNHTIMERQTRLVLLVFAFFAAGALLTSSAAAAAADLSAGAQAMPSSLHALRRVEDDASSFVESVEEAAYPRRRALYGGGSISYAALAASKAACYGPCPARGQAYSRGCQAIYQCRG
ncbi:unnamed protein product [Miscanthus lutarioriparius]|uniref:Uncharacterized protein n=1 Tax=Miscanthus lutarioriparius TaxID=422564 RepID=A0A811RLH5_9POAL|nr:unnamed protein product [Miscanthus lutarioriparius]